MSSAMTSRLTNSEIRAKRTKIFSQEQQRQKDLIPRIEKIQAINFELNLMSYPESCWLNLHTLFCPNNIDLSKYDLLIF